MREAKLSLEAARELYNQGGASKQFALDNYTEEELKEPKLPKTWGEAASLLKGKESYSLGYYGRVVRWTELYDKNHQPTKELTKQHLALMQLTSLREIYRKGWKPTDENKKWCIYWSEQGFGVSVHHCYTETLSFPDEKTAREFLTNFRDLIEKAGDLI